MTPFDQPPRKSPLARTRRPQPLPVARSRTAHLLTRAAAQGVFALPACTACGATHFPARDICPDCLSDAIAARPAAAAGLVLAQTRAEVPSLPYFRERAPWDVGLIQLDAGPQALAHLHPDCRMGDRVQLSLRLDKGGQAVLHAAPKDAPEGVLMTDPKWREMVAHPLHRRVLITDARHFAAPAMARALLKAGAAEVRLGLPEAWKPLDTRPFDGLPVQLLPLDMGSDRSVADHVRDYGGKTEIVVNTAERVRSGGMAEAQAMMEALVFGPMRLAAALAPAMIGRGADGPAPAAAWVNLLSIHALTPLPALPAWSAAQAAAQAFSLGLRAELAQGGLRLVNLYAGPTEDDWWQSAAPPRVGAGALAQGLLRGLAEGLEEVFIGPVSEDLRDRLAANPKAVERDLAQGG